AQEILTDPKKVEVVRNFLVPTTIQQLCEFLGRKLYLDPSQQEAFQLLKEKLTSAPVLAYSNFDQEFLLFTDTS
ncbi:21924_t:CDS:2, partial [Gigaspora rosea]